MVLFTSSTAIIALIGIIIGSASASRIGSATDRFTSAFAVISSSFPVWWIGMLMILLFAYDGALYPVLALQIGIFPARATPDIAPGDLRILSITCIPHGFKKPCAYRICNVPYNWI